MIKKVYKKPAKAFLSCSESSAGEGTLEGILMVAIAEFDQSPRVLMDE